MSSLNSKSVSKKTYGGGVARTLTNKQLLERSVLCCLLWEDTFYESGEDIVERICDLVSKVDVDDVLEIARKAKFESKLRHVPLLMLVELLKHVNGSHQGRIATHEIVPFITRADDMIELLALYWRDGKKPLSKPLVKAIQESFPKFDEYQLAKYRRNNKSIKLRDVLKITRPKPSSQEQAELWGKLKDDTLKTPDTWEVAISACNNDGEKKVQFKRLIEEKKLGALAFLRNLRLMQSVGVEQEVLADYFDVCNFSNIIPFQFISAAAHAPMLEGNIEQAFFQSFDKEEKIDLKATLLVDVSGSMDWSLSSRSQMSRQDAAASLAMMMREYCTDINIYAFGNNVYDIPPRRGMALRDCLHNRNEGTEMWNSLSVVDKKHSQDLMVVITDEQTADHYKPLENTGLLVIINVSTDKHSVQYGQNTISINGWSDSVIKYIREYVKEFN